jgi:endonuclease-8
VPEGDTIFNTARTLNRALAGRLVTRFESVFPKLTRVHDDHPITGRSVESVTSLGKHVLMTFSGDLTLRTHMRMSGSWHIYRIGERWRQPARNMRIVVSTDTFVAVAFNVPVAEFLTARDLARHAVLRALGPDLAGTEFDRDEVMRRIRMRGRDAIGDVLLDQRVVSGAGNVLKSEILFVSGIDPFTAAADLPDAALGRLLDVARKLLAMNTSNPGTSLNRARGRHTTGSLDQDAKLFVYGRGGKPCRRCGTAIAAKKTGVDARLTYWCPSCQGNLR